MNNLYAVSKFLIATIVTNKNYRLFWEKDKYQNLYQNMGKGHG